jgi:glycosyltransferase involved in cell wall biosynthesis
VIPTRGRETRLAFALDALAAQTVAPERFEVIVVRDQRPVEPLTEPPPGLQTRFVSLEQQGGPAVKRNAGWRSTSAPLIAFTDDDCRPLPDWLENLVEAWGGLGQPEDAVVQGRTEPDPDEVHLFRRHARSQMVTGPSDWYQCCNIAYPRALLERLGGFDPSFGFGGEDTDLGLRAIESGARRVYVDRARTWHAVHTRGLVEAIRSGFSWDGAPLVFARHPQHRRVIPHHLFLKDTHEKVLLAAAGLALAGRTRGLSLLAVLPYVERHWNWDAETTLRRLAGYPPYVCERFIADAAEVVGTVRAAIRHRTPLL